MDSSLNPLALPVEGKSLMPLCHFDLAESDYLNRRVGGGHTLESSEIVGAKIVEFSPCTLGLVTSKSGTLNKQDLVVFIVSSCFNRKFDVINPTSKNYNFTWSTDSSSLSKPFTCLYQQGTVEAGKKFKVSKVLSTEHQVYEYQLLRKVLSYMCCFGSDGI